MIMSKQEELMIFVDHNNLFHNFQKIKRKFDYLKLMNLITQDRKLIQMIRYSGTEYTRNKRRIYKLKRFEAALNKLGIISKTIFIKILANGTRIEKEIDVKLATDMVAFGFKDRYDTAALVSGDGDFRPAIDWIKKLNKNAEVWTFRDSLSRRIKNVVDMENIHFLDDHLKEIERK
ncbi:MAG: NYN domain-containing protein [Candidatus Lokiarchaeota archaeon]|nr:NYN domain-containing protein [Candidatus Lokiarchaeota archaeon]